MKRVIVLSFLAVVLVAVTVSVVGAAEPLSADMQAEGENCVNCHTDKEALQNLAVEPEEEEELSEGEG